MGHHHHPHPDYAARAHPELVVLEIGDDLGALIVYTDPDLHGKEVELSRRGEDERRSHKDVLERSQAGASAYTAVFDKVVAGTYSLWLDDVAIARDVVVEGGAITELDWRTASLAV